MSFSVVPTYGALTLMGYRSLSTKPGFLSNKNTPEERLQWHNQCPPAAGAIPMHRNFPLMIFHPGQPEGRKRMSPSMLSAFARARSISVRADLCIHLCWYVYACCIYAYGCWPAPGSCGRLRTSLVAVPLRTNTALVFLPPFTATTAFPPAGGQEL